MKNLYLILILIAGFLLPIPGGVALAFCFAYRAGLLTRRVEPGED